MGILVYHSGALGDFVTTLPVVAYLRSRYPNRSFTLLGNKSNGELGTKLGLFEHVWDIDSSRWGYLFSESCKPETLRILDNFSHAVVFAHARSPFIGNLRKCAALEVLHQTPFPLDKTPIVEYHLALAGICTGLNSWAPFTTAHGRGSGRTRTVAIHPGSGSTRKNWPLERFSQCAHDLQHQGYNPLWILGPCEQHLLPSLKGSTAVSPTVTECADILSTCCLFLGNDSGVMHLAAAMGCPVVALFGPSDPEIWGPYTPLRRIMYKGGKCSPCHSSVITGHRCNRRCLKDITVKEVFAACHSLLKESTSPRRKSQSSIFHQNTNI